MTPEFDPACEFLLDIGWLNLFEHASARPSENRFRCKGCREIVSGGKREAHHLKHRNERDRRRRRVQEENLTKARRAAARARGA